MPVEKDTLRVAILLAESANRTHPWMTFVVGENGDSLLPSAQPSKEEAIKRASISANHAVKDGGYAEGDIAVICTAVDDAAHYFARKRPSELFAAIDRGDLK